MHPYEKELSAFVAEIDRTLAAAELIPPAMSATKIRAVNMLVQEKNRINGLLGLSMEMPGQHAPQPLTHIMGEVIELRKPVTAQDIQPTNQERDKFISEVDALYAQFPDLTDEQINNRKQIPGGEVTIRAVAKKAGYSDYKEGKVNAKYIQAVKKIMADRKEFDAKIAAAEDQLKTV